MIREIPNTCPCCGKTSLVDNIFGDKESKIICYDCKLALFGTLAPVMVQQQMTATQAYNFLKSTDRFKLKKGHLYKVFFFYA